MDRGQFLCVKAIHAEVDSLISEGWRIKSQYIDAEMGMAYILTHEFNGMITVISNSRRTVMQVRKNGKLKKCLNFGV